jgi:4-hydroxybenzoate polyprenyltransferase
MRRTLLRLAPILHLTRVTTAFAAIANAWFVILWTRAAFPLEHGPEALLSQPEWLVLIGGALNALGLFAYGAALNDLLDFRRDRTLHPDRPIPTGAITMEWAVGVVGATFMTAIIGASILGMEAVLLTVLVASAILLFHAAGKFIPAFGLVLLGLIYAGHMVVPNLHIVFVWPVWLVMTHSLVVGGVTHAIARKVPAVSRRAAFAAIAGWAFWTFVMFSAGWWRERHHGGLWPEWVQPTTAIGPALLILLFALMAWQKVRVHGMTARAADKVARYGSLWQALYAVAWLLGQGFERETVIVGVLTGVGFLGMTVLRELYGLVEQPVGYRR